MTRDPSATYNPELDLVLSRVVAAPRARIWAAWTEPDLLTQWFCPAPWSVNHAEIDRATVPRAAPS